MLSVISCFYVNTPKARVNKDEVYTVLSMFVSNVLNEQRNPLHEVLISTTPIIICYGDSERKRTIEINGTSVFVLSKSDIMLRTDSIGPFMYFNFNINFAAKNEIIAELTIQWAIPEGFEILQWFSGDGIAGVFQKRDSEWVMCKILTVEAKH